MCRGAECEWGEEEGGTEELWEVDQDVLVVWMDAVTGEVVGVGIID